MSARSSSGGRTGPARSPRNGPRTGRSRHRSLKASGTSQDRPHARRRNAHLMFLDESGFMLTPTARRSFAPRGQTPILKGWDRHDRISAISGITVSPKKRRLGLYFQLMPDDVNVHGEDRRVPRATAAAHPRADDDPVGPGQRACPLEGGAGLPGRAPGDRDRAIVFGTGLAMQDPARLPSDFALPRPPDPWPGGPRSCGLPSSAQRRPPRDPGDEGAAGSAQTVGGTASRAVNFSRWAVISSRLASPRK